MAKEETTQAFRPEPPHGIERQRVTSKTFAAFQPMVRRHAVVVEFAIGVSERSNLSVRPTAESSTQADVMEMETGGGAGILAL